MADAKRGGGGGGGGRKARATQATECLNQPLVARDGFGLPRHSLSIKCFCGERGKREAKNGQS